MERVAEQDERGIRRIRLGGGEAGDAAAVRVAADRDIRGRRHHEMEGGQRVLGLALGEVDGRGGHAACSQPATNGAMLADVPLAPCPRKQRRRIATA